MRGSSPRLRGTLRLSTRLFDWARFIPAPAGNANQRSRIKRQRAVHPRACGERAHLKRLLIAIAGSSPRLRGTLLVDFLDRVEGRFIPAPAGNAQIEVYGEPENAVHPRACGERTFLVEPDEQPAGSSPRLRGTPRGQRVVAQVDRFIPAPAGNAPKAVPVWISTRFIPAPAGNAYLLACDGNWKTVHPRACGERRSSSTSCSRSDGSSPRLRGTRGDGICGHCYYAVHPRACGER